MSSVGERVYIGIDLGAESGRVVAGHFDGRALRIEVLHRFPTGVCEIAGTLRWEVDRFWREIQRGLARAGERFGGRVASIGVDTWGVDYVLLDEAGELVEQPWNYRDPRNLAAYADAQCRARKSSPRAAASSCR